MNRLFWGCGSDLSESVMIAMVDADGWKSEMGVRGGDGFETVICRGRGRGCVVSGERFLYVCDFSLRLHVCINMFAIN